jgi:hypothetical protein
VNIAQHCSKNVFCERDYQGAFCEHFDFITLYVFICAFTAALCGLQQGITDSHCRRMVYHRKSEINNKNHTLKHNEATLEHFQLNKYYLIKCNIIHV